ncbi:Uncharacterised protein [Klebsiella pneumoniae]|nr:Uncharacterised protein [Klebsiella pneumoniae]
MVEDQTGVLPGRSTQSATKRLQPANFALCRPGVNDATNIAVEAGHQHTNADNDFCGASLEPVNDEVAFIGWCLGNHNLSVNACAVELQGDKVGMILIDAERYSRQVTTISKPVINDIAHQVRSAHNLG